MLSVIFLRNRLYVLVLFCALLAACAVAPRGPYVSPPPVAGGTIVFQTAAATDSDPFVAAAKAAAILKEKMGNEPIHAILVADCFDEESLKRRVMQGAAAVFPADILFGGATYGTFSQAGSLDLDAVGMIAIGGTGIGVSSALEENLGVGALSMETDGDLITQRLGAAGKRLAEKLPQSSNNRLIVLMADAHSPKNQFLIEGMHPVVGEQFPITGGSVNKNAGQTFLYYQGEMYSDSAFALVLSGDFTTSLAGRRAKTNEAVIATAGDGAREALGKLKGRPLAFFAFNCGGRKGKLERLEDELEAFQKVVGKDIPIFGCYCAGEFGPLDAEEKTSNALSGGSGWHVMCTFIGRE